MAPPALLEPPKHFLTLVLLQVSFTHFTWEPLTSEQELGFTRIAAEEELGIPTVQMALEPATGTTSSSHRP